MAIKEKVENIISDFLERNKDCAIHVYIRNGVTGNIIAEMILTMDRDIEPRREKYLVIGNVGNMKYCNNLSLSYDEIMDCYEENIVEDGLKIAEMAVVILKNGIKIEFECVGLRM